MFFQVFPKPRSVEISVVSERQDLILAEEGQKEMAKASKAGTLSEPMKNGPLVV